VGYKNGFSSRTALLDCETFRKGDSGRGISSSQGKSIHLQIQQKTFIGRGGRASRQTPGSCRRRGKSGKHCQPMEMGRHV